VSPQTSALIVAALTVVGLAALLHALSARRVSIAEVQARLHSRHAASTIRSTLSPARHIADASLGRWLGRSLGTDLALAETTVVDVIGNALSSAAIGFVAGLLAGGAAVVAGGSYSIWWPFVAVVVAVLFATISVNQVRVTAQRRRRELRRTVNDFVQLIAIALTTNRSVEEALRFAVDAGDGHSWRLLHHAIYTAEPIGIPVWEALSTMATTYQIDELHGLATSLARQADVGVSVATTVRAEAQALRNRQLTDLAEAADKANSNLGITTMGMVIGLVLFLAHPIVEQLSQSF
jgi:Flp pilus assembly protein TadB